MTHPKPASGRPTRPSAWSPLTIATFRAVWLASLTSNIGIWLGNVGTAWLMTELRPTPVMVTMVQAQPPCRRFCWRCRRVRSATSSIGGSFS
jgi:transmembrane secretion effector